MEAVQRRERDTMHRHPTRAILRVDAILTDPVKLGTHPMEIRGIGRHRREAARSTSFRDFAVKGRRCASRKSARNLRRAQR